MLSSGGSGSGIQWVTLFLISPYSPNQDFISRLKSAGIDHLFPLLSSTQQIYFAVTCGFLSFTLIHFIILPPLRIKHRTQEVEAPAAMLSVDNIQFVAQHNAGRHGNLYLPTWILYHGNVAGVNKSPAHLRSAPWAILIITVIRLKYFLASRAFNGL